MGTSSFRRTTVTSPACRASPARDVEYVAEGGNLRVYNTLTDTLLIYTYNNIIEIGTILITGQVIDVKAIDFF